jgi:crossover junction endodeoxyribonuclease RuvC
VAAQPSSPPRPAGITRILGIDPGSVRTGWGVVDRQGSRLASVAHGVIRCRDAELPLRLAYLSRELRKVILDHRPDAAVLETPFHGVNARSLIVLAQARGALVVTLALEALEVAELAPAEVKLALAGNGRADKKQVARMVQLILGLGGERLAADTTDALAVAICYAQRLRINRFVALEKSARRGTSAKRKRLKRKD